MSRKRRERELSTVKVVMDGEEIERKRSVKRLGVMLDDALSWRDQVENVRRKCFAGLAKLRTVLPSRTTKQIYNGLGLNFLT